MDDHLRAVSRVYGPETWDVYEVLDRSLNPRGPELMLALATERLTSASIVLDVGCRDASHLIDLVRATGASGVGIDPVDSSSPEREKPSSHAAWTIESRSLKE
jgi:hypothetical protein